MASAGALGGAWWSGTASVQASCGIQPTSPSRKARPSGSGSAPGAADPAGDPSGADAGSSSANPANTPRGHAVTVSADAAR
ncbi:hypothetical protein BC477_15205 [Clavibacter michiganensis subsp. michiganensis]|uniref:Uncharacterized protein n=1 Tax=Clavibacter michiganensis subsp. michiganensis TaxID=33013 RepID=A0A251XDU8_CLAMM|nr:hypothetical protein BC477_15205 [Clavibacter michiganensis subsp. michiganensis]OUD99813.1 hypothetical protein CMMCAS07_20275 [Clavibacter michiganensis subsp. michiganensis]